MRKRLIGAGLLTVVLIAIGVAYFAAWKHGYPVTELWAPANIPNWVLCLVGAWAGLMALRTLNEIRIQAKYMESQTKILQDSVSVARDSAKAANDQIATMKAAERARLAIRQLKPPEVGRQENILEGRHPLRVVFFVENIGKSKAFNTRASGVVDFISDPEKGSHEHGFFQDFPQILDEGNETHRLSLAGFGTEFDDLGSSGDFISVPPEFVNQIREGKTFIQASGLLAYEDIYGDPHETPFRFVWKSRGNYSGTEWPDRSVWVDYSPDST